MNALRAMASDLAYLEAWSLGATGGLLRWLAPEGFVLRFVAHHLYDPARRAEDPSHGMPGVVEAALRQSERLRAGGSHAPSTVRRRLALWSTFHRWLGFEGPFSSPSLCGAVRLAARAARPLRSRSGRRDDPTNRCRGLLRHSRRQPARRRARPCPLPLSLGPSWRSRAELAIPWRSRGTGGAPRWPWSSRAAARPRRAMISRRARFAPRRRRRRRRPHARFLSRLRRPISAISIGPSVNWPACALRVSSRR